MPSNRDNNPRCSVCRKMLEFSPDYDALFCPRCNEWREEGCGKRGCEFCGNRPGRPHPVTTGLGT